MPHSSTVARKQMERVPEIDAVAKHLTIEVIFTGIPVPEPNRRGYRDIGHQLERMTAYKQAIDVWAFSRSVRQLPRKTQSLHLSFPDAEPPWSLRT